MHGFCVNYTKSYSFWKISLLFYEEMSWSYFFPAKPNFPELRALFSSKQMFNKFQNNKIKSILTLPKITMCTTVAYLDGSRLRFWLLRHIATFRNSTSAIGGLHKKRKLQTQLLFMSQRVTSTFVWYIII